MVKWNLTRSTYLAATGEEKIEMLQMWHHIDTKTVATGLEYDHIFLEAFEFHDLYVIADSQLLGSYPRLPQGPLYIGIRAGGHLLEVSHLKYNGSLCISAGENGFKRQKCCGHQRTTSISRDGHRTCRVRWSALITYQNWKFPDLAVMCMTRIHQAASIIALNTSVH